MAENIYRLPLIELKTLLPGNNLSETYRHLFGLAVKAKAKPKIVDCSKLEYKMIRLSPVAKGQLDLVADQYGLTPQAAFAGLCFAGQMIMEKQNRQQAGVQEEIEKEIRIPFQPKSDNQRRFYEQIMLGLMSSKITFAEGSTGIGKSRAMAAAAIEMVRLKKTPVVLAAPTVAVVEHLHSEMQRLDTGEATYTILPGASEFVDDIALGEYIDAAQNDPKIDIDQDVVDWFSRGAPALHPDAPLARTLSAMGTPAAWLMNDFRQLAKNMPVNDFILRNAKQQSHSLSAALLESLRDCAKTKSDIIICTHAMLAIGQQTQWQAMPKPCVLIIDEAHQFEQSVASVNSSQFSLYSLRIDLTKLCKQKKQGKNSITNQALVDTASLMKYFQKFDIPAGENYCLTDAEPSPEEQERREMATMLLRALTKKLTSRSADDIPRIEQHRMTLKAILNSLESPPSSRKNNRVDLSFSPDRRYPSLYCGPARVDKQLKHMWNTAQGGVVLASATLYVMDASGNNKCDYLRYLLAVDFSRIMTPAPVIEPYIYSLPCLYTPSTDSCRGLIPPRQQNNYEAEKKWHENLVHKIWHIVDTAHGGTLVLFTAYKTIQAVTTLLEQSGVEAARIVAQQPNQKFSACEYRFREIHAKGERPIMLALGTAWTGIDLKDYAASDENDTLLTDLVISRLPINLNKSNSMISRVEKMGVYPLINECLLTFKQGLGRLIRRDNVKHRRIWILDGRAFISDNWYGMNTLTGAIRRLLRGYHHHKEF